MKHIFTALALCIASTGFAQLKNYCLSCTAPEANAVIQQCRTALQSEGETKTVNAQGMTYTLRKGADSVVLLFQGGDRYDLKQVRGSYAAVAALYRQVFGSQSTAEEDNWRTNWKEQTYNVRLRKRGSSGSIHFY